MAKMQLGVAGAGIAGRLLAWRLAISGHQVTVFDAADEGEEQACSYAAAGMLSPWAEAETGDAEVQQLGQQSLSLYQRWLPQLSSQVLFKRQTSLVTAHPSDQAELQQFSRLLARHQLITSTPQNIDQWEPELAHLGQAIALPEEGLIDPKALLKALKKDAQKHGAEWCHQTTVQAVKPNTIQTLKNILSFDWVFDCRGLGARPALPLRGVRGELLWLNAPDVAIKHVTRLLHPRYRLYVVPRPDHTYLIGATEIESEDMSPISVRSTLELLSAAYSIHPGFGEARIIHSVTHCRPTLSDNRPLAQMQNGLGLINGLYRHGFLLAPALVDQITQQLESFQ